MKHTPIAYLTTTGGLLAMSAALLLAGLFRTVPVQAAAETDRFPISVEDLDARRAAVFAATDTNGDGLISAEEFDAHSSKRAHGSGPRHRRSGDPGFEHRGQDHGDRGHWSERQAAMDGLIFQALDKDGDGVVSEDEFSRQAMAEARASIMKTRLFDRLDKNEDGYLTPEEFPPARLRSMDANGDGEITRDELGHRHFSTPDV